MAMRLGPTVMEWRSVPKMSGVEMGPITCAGCHSACVGAGLPGGVAGDATFGIVWCGDAEGGGEGLRGTVVAGDLGLGDVTLTRISLSPGLRSGPISSQSKAPQSLCWPVTTPLTVAT